jgi:hypothetical protein
MGRSRTAHERISRSRVNSCAQITKRFGINLGSVPHEGFAA